jgi:hypothetical protein
MHARLLLPGRSKPQNRMTVGQRWSYLAGGLQWYGDLLGLLFLVFLLAGAANLATGGGELFRKLTPFLVATVPVLVLLGLIRAVALLRRSTGASWRDAIGAFFIWQSTSLVVARASVLALFAKKAAFLRTPKTSEQAKWWEALRANWAESLLALLGMAGIVAGLSRPTELAGPLLALLLIAPTAGLAAAPVNSWAAQRAALPADMRRWRTTEWRRTRDRRAFVRGAATGGLVTVGAVIIAAVALMLAPSRHQVQTPALVQTQLPSHTHSAAPRHPAGSRSPSPAPSPSPSVTPSSRATSSAPPSSPPASSSSPASGATSIP